MTREISFRFTLPIVIGSVLVMVWFVVPRGGPSASDPAPPTEACLQCHEEQAASLGATAHAVATEEKDAAKSRVACSSCHSGDRRHWEGEPQDHPMSIPAELGVAAEARLCATCHMTAHQQNMREKNVHARNGVGCSGCHSVHASRDEPLLARTQTDLCLGCHAPMAGEFAKPFRHPVKDGVMECSDCHVNLDETRRGLTTDGTNRCAECHAEVAGPFVHEHPAALDFSTEEAGCLSCHDPHGSYLPRMLVQPYQPPNFQLCTQCHSVPGHRLNTQHGTAFAGVPCSDCHSDIHGSNTSRHFLSETLEGQGCFNAGCHAF